MVTKVPNISGDGPETLQIHQAGDEQRWFELDAVLDQNCSQQEVYEKSGAYKAISEDLFSGFNCTVSGVATRERFGGDGSISLPFLLRCEI